MQTWCRPLTIPHRADQSRQDYPISIQECLKRAFRNCAMLAAVGILGACLSRERLAAGGIQLAVQAIRQSREFP